MQSRAKPRIVNKHNAANMVHFTFGIGRFFSFSFRIGPPTCPCTNKNYTHSLSYDRLEGKKARGGKEKISVVLPAVPRFPSETPQYEIEDAAEPVETLVTEGRDLSSCHFLTIPSEIRVMIYEILLISKGPVVNAHKLMCPQKSVFAGNRAQIKDIDATILRTSRSIYHEALQTLYQKNNFYFNSPDAIESFAFCELPRRCVFGMKPRQYGRLTMLTKVNLRLGLASLPILRAPGHHVDRELLWGCWRDFFEPSNADIYPPRMMFPAVQWLFLDFSDWELDGGKESKLDVCSRYQPILLHIISIALMLINVTSQVKRFVTKFRGCEGLRSLVIKGVVHQTNLNDFRSLLAKPESTFLALDRRHHPIMGGRRGINLPV